MSGVSGVSANITVESNTETSMRSLQLMFAKLQLELSETAKEQAMKEMDTIKDSQQQQKAVSAMLQQARQLKADANSGKGDCTWDNKASMMPTEMADYMDKNKLAYDKTGSDEANGIRDLASNSDEWDVAIASLEAHLETIGNDTQTKMVLLQDFMGQYNSYLQGANSQISSSNQTLTQLARGN